MAVFKSILLQNHKRYNHEIWTVDGADFFSHSESPLRYPSIYHSLIFGKRLIDKHLSNYYPNHPMLHNPATQKQSATLQCADCDENLNLNRVFGHSI